MKKETRTTIILALVFLLLIGGAAGAYFLYRGNNSGNEDEKTITINVVNGTDTKTFTINTKESMLLGALNQEKLAQGSESAFGFYITEVNGVKANESENQWWEIKQNGKPTGTGVAITPIKDGDVIELILSTY